MPAMLVGLLVTALLVAAILRYGVTTPKVHRVPYAKLHYFLSQLLRRGYNGGIAIIREPQTRRFVRASKYFTPDGSMGLDICVPTSVLSEVESERFTRWLGRVGLEWRPFDSTPERPAVPYPHYFYTRRRATEVNSATMIAVDCGSDVAVARAIVEGIFSDVFGIEHGSGYLVELWGGSPKDELVEKPGS